MGDVTPHFSSTAARFDAASNQLHQPVLVERCLELLEPSVSRPSQGARSVVIDCTLGLGGHTEAILKAFPAVTVIGIDRDAEAISLASRRLAGFGQRFIGIHTTYDDVDRVAARYGEESGRVDAVLMDLGVSSMQLDVAERGFSYSHDAPLDMRMDQASGKSAAQLLASAPEAEIARILREYGEEKFASRIAHAIVEARASQPLQTTSQLVELVRQSIPAPARRTGGNPAKRTFQALRIAVNNELAILQHGVPRAVESVRIGGRVVIESYQSLEDKIVKRAFRKGIESSSPPGLPVELESHKPYLRDLTHGAYLADAEEIARNSRAASVRLRAVERTRETPEHQFDPDSYRGASHE